MDGCSKCCVSTDLPLRQDCRIGSSCRSTLSERRAMIRGEALTMRAEGPRTQVPHPGRALRPRTPSSAHSGDVLTKVLPFVLPFVRNLAKSLETSFRISAYPKYRLTVQRRKPIDGCAGTALRRPNRSSSETEYFRQALSGTKPLKSPLLLLSHLVTTTMWYHALEQCLACMFLEVA